MKNLIIIINLFSIQFLFSQENYLFNYRITYQSDSTNSFKKSEDFHLIRNENGFSFFASSNLLKKDSLINQIGNTELSIIDMAKFPKTNFKYYIIKDSKDSIISFYDNVIKHKFIYEENPDFNWFITNEKQNIGKLSCRKATTAKFGRNWTACFSEEIPISDGPYKFSGLPGLILKISDEKNHYTFELIEIKKNKY